ncbi:MAG: hypothetical protein V4472_25100 [Pseudomonadota bacterium]
MAGAIVLPGGIQTAPPPASTATIVSGTPWQNTTTDAQNRVVDVEVRVSVTYNALSLTAATLAVATGSSSPGSQGTTEQSIPAGLPIGIVITTVVYVPANHWLRLDVANATLGLARVRPI